MTYNEILSELDEVGLKEKFIEEYETYAGDKLMKMLKETNSIHSTGAIIRLLIPKYRNDKKSLDYGYWHNVLIYFMTPKFARVINF